MTVKLLAANESRKILILLILYYYTIMCTCM